MSTLGVEGGGKIRALCAGKGLPRALVKYDQNTEMCYEDY